MRLRRVTVVSPWRRLYSIALPPRREARGGRRRQAYVITGRAVSAFERADTYQRVETEVDVYRSAQDAADAFRACAYVSPRGLLELFRTEAGDAGLTHLQARRLPLRRVGDQRAGYRLSMRVAGKARSVSMWMDMVFVRKGRSIAGFLTVGPVQPVGGLDRLIARTVPRLASS